MKSVQLVARERTKIFLVPDGSQTHEHDELDALSALDET